MTDAVQGTFGRMPDGRQVAAVTLTSGAVSATVIAYGASLQAVHLAGRDGSVADVVVGYDDMAGLLADRSYCGSTIGRVANRIAGGGFALDGQRYQVPVNLGPNALHGGTAGFDKAVWDVLGVGDGAVTFGHRSPAGTMGFPGNLDVTATYRLVDDRLTIDYIAHTDAPTIVNLTNHVYWNLAGRGDAMGHRLTMPAQHYLATDEHAIPTGELTPVEGTVFDFRLPRIVGDRVRDSRDAQLVMACGYDHNWVFGDAVSPDLRHLATLADPQSGRAFDLWSNQPGMQFYSSNFFNGTQRGKGGALMRQGDAIALEPQLFPDGPNQPGFPSMRLDPGEIYRNRIEYRFRQI